MANPLESGHRRQTLLAMASAILPPSSPAALVETIVDDVIAEASHIPIGKQNELAGFVDLLDRGLFMASLGARARPLRLQTRDAIEQALLRLSTHPIPQLRAGFQAIRRGLCFVGYGRSEGSAPGQYANPLWRDVGYPGPRADRPKSFVEPIAVAAAMEAPEDADVVVIGSGAGGAVAAAVFAEAGRSVVVLEEGEHITRASIDQRELAGFRRMFLDRGATASDDLGVGILAGRAVGGGTVVNWNVSLRLADDVGADWDRASGLDGLAASLTPHYDVVAQRLGLATSADNENNVALRAGCAALGWNVAPTPRNADGCGVGCGYCSFGCAYGKKRDTPATFLRDAAARGARIIAGAAVDRVVIEGEGASRRATAVEFHDAARTRRRITARLVVVAAGSLRTPGVLARSGLRARALGRSLHLHPTSAVLGVFDHPVEPWHGAPMSSVCKRFCHRDGSHGAVIEAAPVHPGLASVAIPWFGAAAHARDLGALSRTACLIAITRDRDGGTIEGEATPTIRYKVSRFDGRSLLEAVAAIPRILFAAGALEVYTTHTPPLRLLRQHASEPALQRLADDVLRAGHAPNRLAVFSAHQMGSARMSARARDGVVDERGAVHGVRALLVCDASVFPAASGVNPMLTIMAMARRTAMLHA